MFDIGSLEFFIAALVALVVLGPERLPAALRNLGLWIGRLRRSYYNVKTEVEREIGMDEVRRQLHNEQIMADVKRVEREVQALGQEVEALGQEADDGDASAAAFADASIAPSPEIAAHAPPGASEIAGAAANGAKAEDAARQA